jgi:hypothetical protein
LWRPNPRPVAPDIRYIPEDGKGSLEDLVWFLRMLEFLDGSGRLLGRIIIADAGSQIIIIYQSAFGLRSLAAEILDRIGLPELPLEDLPSLMLMMSPGQSERQETNKT